MDFYRLNKCRFVKMLPQFAALSLTCKEGEHKVILNRREGSRSNIRNQTVAKNLKKIQA